MNRSEFKSALIVGLAFLALLLGTCQFRSRLNGERPVEEAHQAISESLYLKEKEQQIAVYEKRLNELQGQRDSLWQVAVSKKRAHAGLRPGVHYYQQQLRKEIASVDSLCYPSDSLRSAADSLIVFQNRADSACLESIEAFEQLVGNRDSSLTVLSLTNRNLRDIQKEQELKEQYLTEQLQTALKAQRKKARQNKVLAGSLLLLSGITTAVLAPHYLK